MTEPNAAIAVLALALLLPQGATAQIASKLEAGALVTSKDGELPASTMSRLSPDVRLTMPYVAVTARGSAWLDGQQWEVADGVLSTTMTTPTVHNVRGEIVARASRAFDDRSIEDDQLDAQGRVYVLLRQRGGIWVGAGAARPWRVAVVSWMDVTGGGAWTRVGDATLSTTYTNFLFTKVAPSHDSTGTTATCGTRSDLGMATVVPRPSFSTVPAASTDCRRYSRFADLEGAMHWEYAALELSAHTGYRFGESYDVNPDSRRWAAATATYWITSQVAAVIGGGRLPASPMRGIPARNYASFGMVFAYSPVSRGTVPVVRTAMVRSFDIHPIAPGMEKITVRVGGVESVEVMGDFSDWQPVPMIRHGRDLWDLTLAMEPGVHRLNVRIDGGPWLPPPSMPTLRDAFSGEVGMVVVPERQ